MVTEEMFTYISFQVFVFIINSLSDSSVLADPRKPQGFPVEMLKAELSTINTRYLQDVAENCF